MVESQVAFGKRTIFMKMVSGRIFTISILSEFMEENRNFILDNKKKSKNFENHQR
jgi:hypothetical protein